MRYNHIRKMDISNGKAIGVSLFVQGCHFHCHGCFNQETWDFDGGKEWDATIEEQFLKLIERSYIKRVSILGGEPMEQRNIVPLTNLLIRIKEKRPEIKIWIYTGYVYEKLLSMDSESFPVKKLLSYVDTVVDGQFQLDKQDVNHMTMPFAGSTNQRVINIKSN